MRGLFGAILTILWPILACAAVFSQKPDTGSLKGRVKSVVVTTSHFGGGSTRDLHSFDKFGHLIESVSMGDQAEPRYRSVYRYDAAGRRTESLRFRGMEEEERTTYQYDDKGTKIGERVYDGKGSLLSKATFTSGVGGGFIRTTEYFKNGSLEGTTVDRLDAKWRLLLNASLNGSRDEYRYDDDGSTTVRVFDSEGVLKSWLVRKYDPGSRLETLVYYRADDTRAWSWEHLYNEHGDLVSDKFRGPHGSQNYEYAHEYDATGNWVKRTGTDLSNSGKIKETIGEITRKISYFDGKGLPGLHEAPSLNSSSGVMQGSALVRVEPRYPEEAGRDRIWGAVQVEVTVDEEGNVQAVRSLSGPNQLRRAAEQAAHGWKYKPTLLNGMPVRVIGTITFRFNP